ncbi:hypothetical protein LPJ72_002682, partial [Coemansia sp. Benny D160-2]
ATHQLAGDSRCGHDDRAAPVGHYNRSSNTAGNTAAAAAADLLQILHWGHAGLPGRGNGNIGDSDKGSSSNKGGSQKNCKGCKRGSEGSTPADAYARIAASTAAGFPQVLHWGHAGLPGHRNGDSGGDNSKGRKCHL